MLIFCDAGTNKIETMNTDGTGRKVIFQDVGAHFYGLDVDSTYIYFSDWNKEYVFVLLLSIDVNWCPTLFLYYKMFVPP